MRHFVIRNTQKYFKAANTFDNLPERREEYHSYNVVWDVQFATEFPNSYLDIYYAKGGNRASCPVFFYIHGGGYTWGDRRNGDPTGSLDASFWFYEEFLKAGYHVVCVDYAYAPEFHYPTPIILISQAVKYLLNHANKYELNMECLIIEGGSAGGQIAGQFVNIQTNKKYSNEIGIAPVISAASIQAVIFNSALLDIERFGKVNTRMNAFLFKKCGQAYFNASKLKNHPQVYQAKVTEHVSKWFPPCYISDGNTGTFNEQAFELNDKLEALGIRHHLTFYGLEHGVVPHGFEGANNELGHENMRLQLRFLDEILKEKTNL